MTIKLGDRVWYKDNGKYDTGTIIDILLDDYPFVVKWDQPLFEDIDQFKGSQLEPLEGHTL